MALLPLIRDVIGHFHPTWHERPRIVTWTAGRHDSHDVDDGHRVCITAIIFVAKSSFSKCA